LATKLLLECVRSEEASGFSANFLYGRQNLRSEEGGRTFLEEEAQRFRTEQNGLKIVEKEAFYTAALAKVPPGSPVSRHHFTFKLQIYRQKV